MLVRLLLAAACCSPAEYAAAEEAKKVWTFEDEMPGKAAHGFHEEVGEWKVAVEGGAKVLFQSAKNADDTSMASKCGTST